MGVRRAARQPPPEPFAVPVLSGSRRKVPVSSVGMLAGALMLFGNPLVSRADDQRLTAHSSDVQSDASPSSPPRGRADATHLLSVKKSRLANGLRVALHVDSSLPQVAVCTIYGAGTRAAQALPGTAAMVHQMLREGGRSTSGADYSRKVEARGGTIHNTLTADYARYCTLVPKHEVELALWLEAGRMTSYAFNLPNFEKRKAELGGLYLDAVQGAAYSGGQRRLMEIAYQGYTPYERAAPPDPDELEAVEFSDVVTFHREHYRSNNALLSISGDFDAFQVLDLIERHLGARENSGEIASAGPVPILPRQTSPRLSIVIDNAAQTSAAFYGWITPEATAPDAMPLRVAGSLLAGGDSSLLHAELVQKRQLASSVSVFSAGHRGPELFGFYVRARANARLDVIEQTMNGVLSRVVHGAPASETELSAAKRRLEHQLLETVSGNLGRAEYMAAREFLFGDSAELAERLRGIEQVTFADVRRVVKEHLVALRRTSVEIYPKDWHDPNQAAMPRFHVVSSGENLTRIASRYGTSVQAITKMNGIGEKQPIYPGQKLRVPRGTARKSAGTKQRAQKKKEAIAYTVKKGDSLSTIAARHKISVAAILRANPINPKKPLQIGQRLAIPVP